jgi:predicted DNA-binding protein (MmcQ/YjbR family)
VSGDPDWRAYCLAKQGAWPDSPWENDTVVKVGPKIFAFLGAAHDGSSPATSIGLKCGDREAADLWLERYPDHARKMAYIGAHGWNTFILDGTIDDDIVRDLIDTSYELVLARLPRSQRPAG